MEFSDCPAKYLFTGDQLIAMRTKDTALLVEIDDIISEWALTDLLCDLQTALLLNLKQP